MKSIPDDVFNHGFSQFNRLNQFNSRGRPPSHSCIENHVHHLKCCVHTTGQHFLHSGGSQIYRDGRCHKSLHNLIGCGRFQHRHLGMPIHRVSWSRQVAFWSISVSVHRGFDMRHIQYIGGVLLLSWSGSTGSDTESVEVSSNHDKETCLRSVSDSMANNGQYFHPLAANVVQ